MGQSLGHSLENDHKHSQSLPPFVSRWDLVGCGGSAPLLCPESAAAGVRPKQEELQEQELEIEFNWNCGGSSFFVQESAAEQTPNTTIDETIGCSSSSRSGRWKWTLTRTVSLLAKELNFKGKNTSDVQLGRASAVVPLF